VARRALLVINNKSRNGGGDVDAALARFAQEGIDVLVCRLDQGERIAPTIREHAGAVDCVVVGGGDGSLNAAAPALVDTNLPLGVLPMGTANDLARTLKIPADLAQASEIIGAGRLHRIDLGCVNGRYFFNVANIGLGVHVTRHLSSELKRRWGVFGYARSLFSALRSFRPFHADIVCDARRRHVRTIQIAVGNGRHYGGGMTVAEEASIDDHRFHLYSLEPLGVWDMLRFAPALRAGRFEPHHPVDIEQGRCIEIVTRKPMAISADGEVVTSTPARFELLPGAVGVFVPAAYFDDRQEPRHAAQG
jgi:diacylglycerol kinase (ATP)